VVNRDDHSLIVALLSQFQDPKFLQAILEDNSIILWAVLNSILGAWLEIVLFFDMDSKLCRDDETWVDDNWFLWNLMEESAFRQQNLVMLKHSLAILESAGCDNMRSQTDTQAKKAMLSLEIDFRELVTMTENQLTGIQHRITTLAAIRSITESEKSIKQSDRIGCVTSFFSFLRL
jgi:hypothetical protein